MVFVFQHRANKTIYNGKHLEARGSFGKCRGAQLRLTEQGYLYFFLHMQQAYIQKASLSIDGTVPFTHLLPPSKMQPNSEMTGKGGVKGTESQLVMVGNLKPTD